ncbi:hypothetical protein Lesp01_81790 [Lentzea sp. NBRC 102530]|nr:hypothetical protein Lesp01_81790 [Lentzea sp. NBRC 102530]
MISVVGTALSTALRTMNSDRSTTGTPTCSIRPGIPGRRTVRTWRGSDLIRPRECGVACASWPRPCSAGRLEDRSWSTAPGASTPSFRPTGTGACGSWIWSVTLDIQSESPKSSAGSTGAFVRTGAAGTDGTARFAAGLSARAIGSVRVGGVAGPDVELTGAGEALPATS